MLIIIFNLVACILILVGVLPAWTAENHTVANCPLCSKPSDDDQLSFIEAFCAKIREGLDLANFITKRQIIELLDIRGKIAFENGEKVIYLKCLINPQDEQRLSHLQISPS